MRSEWTHFRYAEEDGVATITFGPSEDLNRLAFEVFREVRDLADDLHSRADEVRILVLAGEGNGFCSGGDVELILTRLNESDPRDVYDFAQVTGACVRSLRRAPQPVIAAVNGMAAGAGAVLALACDLRILAERAEFNFLFTRIGITGGDTGICWLLPRVIGLGRATELLMLGERIDSDTALEVGLANRVVPDGELAATVAGYVRRLQAVEPAALARTKEMLNDSAADGPAGGALEEWTDSLLLPSGDFKQFRAGFLGRRRPAAGS